MSANTDYDKMRFQSYDLIVQAFETRFRELVDIVFETVEALSNREAGRDNPNELDKRLDETMSTQYSRLDDLKYRCAGNIADCVAKLLHVESEHREIMSECSDFYQGGKQ